MIRYAFDRFLQPSCVLLLALVMTFAFSGLTSAPAVMADDASASTSAPTAELASAAELSPSQQAFELLKGLSGTWIGKGAYSAGGDAFPAKHEYRVTAAGHTVMEVQNVGTDHEMVSMFYLEDGHLVLNHYCAGGNQPKMALDESLFAAEGTLNFDFLGGTNLDPKTDGHIHGGRFHLADDGTLKATWLSWSEGQPVGELVFTVQREEG
ncbi:MAG: hypothetical protein AAGD01_15890 [Acidobacteriota bacterium]